MKRKVTVQLPEQLVERLEAAAARPDASKSAIVEAALDQFLSADTSDDAALPRRRNWMSRQLEQIDRDLRIVNETVALHARYQLTVTPPLPNAQHRAACTLGLERFEVFAARSEGAFIWHAPDAGDDGSAQHHQSRSFRA
jgi:predicted transcriptional regulator